MITDFVPWPKACKSQNTHVMIIVKKNVQAKADTARYGGTKVCEELLLERADFEHRYISAKSWVEATAEAALALGRRRLTVRVFLFLEGRLFLGERNSRRWGKENNDPWKVFSLTCEVKSDGGAIEFWSHHKRSNASLSFEVILLWKWVSFTECDNF